MNDKATRIADKFKGTGPISAHAFAAALDTVIDKVADRFLAIERRLAEVEQRGLKYCGTWSRASTYKRGQIATHAGALWICSSDQTTATPGTSSDWTLCAKATK